MPDLYDGLLGDQEICIDLKLKIRQSDAQHEEAEKGGGDDRDEYADPLELYRCCFHHINDNELGAELLCAVSGANFEVRTM